MTEEIVDAEILEESTQKKPPVDPVSLATNLRYNKHSGIDGDIEHPVYGNIPYTFNAAQTAELLLGNPEVSGYIPGPPNLKVVLANALDLLRYDLPSGQKIQTRPKDRDNIKDMIDVLLDPEIPISTIDWRMLSNEWHPVSADDLKGALKHGRLEGIVAYKSYQESDTNS